MRTLLPDPPPAEFEALLERRRHTGADKHDEVWEGVLHMMPEAHGRHSRLQHQLALLLDTPACARGLLPMIGFNLGEKDDFRVPDGGLHRPGPDKLYYETAALVVEVLSPGDDTWDKLPFYAKHGVDELLIVDPLERSVDWLALRGDGYEPVERSGLIDLSAEELRARIDWPVVEDD